MRSVTLGHADVAITLAIEDTATAIAAATAIAKLLG